MKSDLLISYYSVTVCYGRPSHECWCMSLDIAKTYTFSAKEKDAETGLSYFGSRYYSSDLSLWLSVDPMSDDWKVKAAWSNIDKMYQKEAGKDVITEMCGENSPKFVITDKKGCYENAANFSPDDQKGGTLYMNGEIENIQTLSHELFHGYQYMKDQGGLSCHNEVEAQLFSFLVCGKETLAPRAGSASSEYLNSYLNLVNNNFSSSEDFPILRGGFLQCSTANAPKEGKKEGLYSSLKTPLGDSSTFLLSKYFK